MTKYRRLDANGDMTFGRGAESFAQGVEAVRQAIETRLRRRRGEWWEPPADGLPLYQQMKALEVPGVKYLYWIEQTLRCYLR